MGSGIRQTNVFCDTCKVNYALRVCIYLYLYLAENALYTGKLRP